jgi:NAD(P)-dependent dehydrogenase (short-subunit alcohol dehydrogenase family)
MGGMELTGARTLVVGASGVLGGALTRALADAGARLVVTARHPAGLGDVEDLAEDSLALDLLDATAAREVVRRAADRLGGLDLVVVASGVAGFGPADRTPDEVAEELFAVNALGPMALLSEAIPTVRDGGALVAVSAILADAPMAGMAAYSASKAALAAWLTAVRREVRRRKVAVLDVRPPHMETGLADRALHGTAPQLPAGYDVGAFVAHVIEAIRVDAQEIVWDKDAKDLVLR